MQKPKTVGFLNLRNILCFPVFLFNIAANSNKNSDAFCADNKLTIYSNLDCFPASKRKHLMYAFHTQHFLTTVEAMNKL